MRQTGVSPLFFSDDSPGEPPAVPPAGCGRCGYEMKTVRLNAIGSLLAETEIDVPLIGPGDLLIRVKAAGICHSDAHYRAGVSQVRSLPLTLGHEVAGVVEETGSDVGHFGAGDRVCLHYLVTCGECAFCRAGNEQFCARAEMIGKHRDGGYAEFIAVPERNAFHLPEEIPFEQGAILMCSSATSLHALKKARLRPGETVAIFGVGGLGISAIQLAGHLRPEEFSPSISTRENSSSQNGSKPFRSTPRPVILSRKFRK